MSAKDGGMAFPGRRTEKVPSENSHAWEDVTYSGMSLRDYFAVRILQAAVTSARLDGIALQLPEEEAITAYEWADAMLKARSA